MVELLNNYSSRKQLSKEQQPTLECFKRMVKFIQKPIFTRYFSAAVIPIRSFFSIYSLKCGIRGTERAAISFFSSLFAIFSVALNSKSSERNTFGFFFVSIMAFANANIIFALTLHWRMVLFFYAYHNSCSFFFFHFLLLLSDPQFSM